MVPSYLVRITLLVDPVLELRSLEAHFTRIRFDNEVPSFDSDSTDSTLLRGFSYTVFENDFLSDEISSHC
jgi:hypothetical protein